MKKLSNKKLFWISSVLVVGVMMFLAAVVGYALGRHNALLADPGVFEAENNFSEDLEDNLQNEITREDVPSNILVPDRNSNPADSTIAIPESVAVIAPGLDSRKRQFQVQFRDGVFSPSTIVINQGDIARIIFDSSVSGDVVQPDYGFKLNLSPEEESILEGHFDASGKYSFYCESCGGLSSQSVGYIIVVPN